MSWLDDRLRMIEAVIDRMEDGCLKVAVRTIWRQMDKDAPVSRKYHHNYKGGLVQHMSEMIRIYAALKKDNLLGLDYDEVITCIIFHDSGKATDGYYTWKGDRCYSKKGIYFPHTHMSLMKWIRIGAENGVDDTTLGHIAHAIEAHHGRAEWQAFDEPRTKLARFIHELDVLSSQVIAASDPQ